MSNLKENVKKTLTQTELFQIQIAALKTILIERDIVSQEDIHKVEDICIDTFCDKKIESMSDKQKELLSSDTGTILWGMAQSALGGKL